MENRNCQYVSPPALAKHLRRSHPYVTSFELCVNSRMFEFLICPVLGCTEPFHSSQTNLNLHKKSHDKAETRSAKRPRIVILKTRRHPPATPSVPRKTKRRPKGAPSAPRETGRHPKVAPSVPLKTGRHLKGAPVSPRETGRHPTVAPSTPLPVEDCKTEMDSTDFFSPAVDSMIPLIPNMDDFESSDTSVAEIRERWNAIFREKISPPAISQAKKTSNAFGLNLDGIDSVIIAVKSEINDWCFFAFA